MTACLHHIRSPPRLIFGTALRAHSCPLGIISTHKTEAQIAPLSQFHAPRTHAPIRDCESVALRTAGFPRPRIDHLPPVCYLDRFLPSPHKCSLPNGKSLRACFTITTWQTTV